MLKNTSTNHIEETYEQTTSNQCNISIISLIANISEQKNTKIIQPGYIINSNKKSYSMSLNQQISKSTTLKNALYQSYLCSHI